MRPTVSQQAAMLVVGYIGLASRDE